MKKARVYILSALIFFISVTFSGCNLMSSCSFSSLSSSVTRLDISVGETIDLQNYISASSGESIFKAKSSDESVIAVLNISTVKAVAEGEAIINAVSATNDKDYVSIRIKAKYSTPSSMQLKTASNLFLKTSEIEPITFNAQLNEGANPNTKFDWYVNEVKQIGNTNSFTFLPNNTANKYDIRVSCQSNQGLNQTKSVVVYDEFESPFTIISNQSSILEGGQIFNASIFNESVVSNAYYTWYVNGESYSNDSSLEFSSNEAGRYEISASVNGQKILDEDGNDTIEVFVRGSITPSNVYIDFVSEYPKINVLWSNTQGVLQLTINKLSYIPIVISDIWAEDNKIDISQYVSVTDSFSISIKGQEYGEIYLSGEEVITVNHTPLTQKAKMYLEKEYVGGRFYVTSTEQIFNLFEYVVAFRPYEINFSDKSQSSATFYVGYNPDISLTKLSALFIDRLNLTGSYQWQLSGNLKKDKEVTITVNFLSKNQPDDFSYNLDQLQRQLIAPNSLSATGLSKKQFASDSYPLSPQKVSTSDQLFYALEKGYNPDLVEGSMAQKLYQDAKNSLALIIDESMDNEQRALAIYDFLMSKVSYDYDVLQYTDISVAVLKSAYYMEGVFETGFAVCDGISKAYSLMCNIVGINCKRVVGSVYTGGAWGEHAWNKILINGNWYIVDATWGIARKQINSTFYKRCTRQYFMLLDSDFILSRLEKGGVYPKTSNEDYYFYNKTDTFIHDTDNLGERLSQIATSMKENKNKTYFVGSNQYDCDYYALEFQFASSISENEIRIRMTNALREAGVTSYEVFTSENILTVAIA